MAQDQSGDFSFLSSPTQQGTSKLRTPGWQVSDEPDDIVQEGGSPVPPDQAAPAAPKAPTLKETDPNTFLKKRGDLYKSIKNESLAAVDRWDAQLNTGEGLSGLPVDTLKTQLMGADPLQHASVLNDAMNQYRQLGGVDEDSILSPVEDAVSMTKRFLSENSPAEASLQGGMAQTDLPGINRNIQNLQNAVQEQRRNLQFAASGRQEARIQGQLSFYQQRLQEEQAKAQQAQQAVGAIPGQTVPDEEMANAAQQAPQSLYGQMVDKNLTFKAVLTSAGWSRPDFVKANTEIWRMLQTHGVKPDDPVTPATFGIIVPKLVEECFNPQVAQKFFDEISTSPAQEAQDRTGGGNAEQGAPGGPNQVAGGGGGGQPTGAGGSDAGDSTVTQGLNNVNTRLSALNARHDQIWQELAHSGDFKNVGDVIGFILTGIVLGPRAAGMLFSNMSRNGNLRGELDQINHETMAMYHQQNSYVQLAQHARVQAANDSKWQSTLQERTAHDKAMEFYMSLRNNQHKDPEVEAVKQQKLLGWRIQKEMIDRLSKAATDPFDPEYKKAKAALPGARNQYFAFLKDMQDWAKKNNIPFHEFQPSAGGADPFRPQGGSFQLEEQ